MQQITQKKLISNEESKAKLNQELFTKHAFHHVSVQPPLEHGYLLRKVEIIKFISSSKKIAQ